MTRDAVRRFCLSLPHAAEDVKWETELALTVGGKMFAVAGLEPGDVWLAFKCSPEEFAELIERPGVRPAPYLARAHWVALETERALSDAEIRRRLARAYDLVREKLPKKVRDGLGAAGPAIE